MNPYEQARLQNKWKDAKEIERDATEAAQSAQQEHDSTPLNEERSEAATQLHLAKWALEKAQDDERQARDEMFGVNPPTEDSL